MWPACISYVSLVNEPGLCHVWIRLVVYGDVCFDSGGVLEKQCVYCSGAVRIVSNLQYVHTEKS